jgi:hypothetical protein
MPGVMHIACTWLPAKKQSLIPIQTACLQPQLFTLLVLRNGLFGMGVADGVYMWREQGIDSGLMSRALMESCRQQVQDGQDDVVASKSQA